MVWPEGDRLTAWVPSQGAQGVQGGLARQLGRRAGRRARDHPRRRRSLRRAIRRRPRGARRRLARPRDPPSGAVDRDALREPARDDARPRAAPDRHPRRPPRRDDAGLPARDRPGLRRVSEDRRSAAVADDPDGPRHVSLRQGRGDRDVCRDEHDPGRCVPRRRPARGHRRARTRGGSVRRRDRHGSGGCAPQEPAARRSTNRTPTSSVRCTTAATTPEHSMRRSTAAGYDELRAEQARRRDSGDVHALGIGIACYVEITGGGDESGPPNENATVQVHADGSATVLTGTSPHGQGHATAWAMLASERLGIPVERITVMHGDTDLVPRGGGTGGSRSLQQGGVGGAAGRGRAARQGARACRGTARGRRDRSAVRRRHVELRRRRRAGRRRDPRRPRGGRRAARRDDVLGARADLPVRRARRGRRGRHRDRQGHAGTCRSASTTRA